MLHSLANSAGILHSKRTGVQSRSSGQPQRVLDHCISAEMEKCMAAGHHGCAQRGHEGVDEQDHDRSLAAPENTKRHSVIRNNEHGMIEVGCGGVGAQNCNDNLAATENTKRHSVIRNNEHGTAMTTWLPLKTPRDTV